MALSGDVRLLALQTLRLSAYLFAVLHASTANESGVGRFDGSIDEADF